MSQRNYSQNAEQEHILEYFKIHPPGKFVDIGAYDVFRFSNTRALYERGWYGVLVEPAPANYRAIADHYAQDLSMEVLNVAVGTPAGMITFFESDGDAVGTTSREHMLKWAAAGVKYSEIVVPQMDTVAFMEKYCRDADFLSIDTESTNIDLFRAIPDFVFDRIKMLCIEHDGHYEEITEACAWHGFRPIYQNAENIILVK